MTKTGWDIWVKLWDAEFLDFHSQIQKKAGMSWMFWD
jgi:hypothetical protein